MIEDFVFGAVLVATCFGALCFIVTVCAGMVLLWYKLNHWARRG